MEEKELDKLYKNAIRFTKSHYENFPVLSFFVKRELRKHVAVIYQFARQADDIADEGTDSKDERVSKLNQYESEFKNSLISKFKSDFWRVLKFTIDTKKLNENNFLNLLKAFKQDIWKNRYSSFDDLLNYCKNSANPVGRLILELNEVNDEYAKLRSDEVCTALQLTNFIQDVKVDLEKNRIYLPEDEMQRFSVDEKSIIQKNFTNELRNLLKFQVDRTFELFKKGRELLDYLPFKLKFQILVTIKGGEEILKKIESINYNVLKTRPTLSKMDFAKIFISTILVWR